MSGRLFTSESVTEGHPDKICDQISDSILDAMLEQDPKSRVAVETMVTTGLVHIAGEVSTESYVEIPQLVRKVIAEGVETAAQPPKAPSAAARARAVAVGVRAAAATAAEAAAEVNLYTTREPGLIRPLLDAYSAKTGVKVNTVFVEKGLAERVAAESGMELIVHRNPEAERLGINPFTEYFEITLLCEGTVRGTGGVRIDGNDCATNSSGSSEPRMNRRMMVASGATAASTPRVRARAGHQTPRPSAALTSSGKMAATPSTE